MDKLAGELLQKRSSNAKDARAVDESVKPCPSNVGIWALCIQKLVRKARQAMLVLFIHISSGG